MGFDYVMSPVVRIINAIHARAKQHRSFKFFLDEHGDLSQHFIAEQKHCVDFLHCYQKLKFSWSQEMKIPPNYQTLQSVNLQNTNCVNNW